MDNIVISRSTKETAIRHFICVFVKLSVDLRPCFHMEACVGKESTIKIKEYWFHNHFLEETNESSY